MNGFCYRLHEQEEIKGPFWAREFAVAHKNVDDEIQNSNTSK